LPQAWKKYATPEFVYDYILVDIYQLKTRTFTMIVAHIFDDDPIYPNEA